MKRIDDKHQKQNIFGFDTRMEKKILEITKSIFYTPPPPKEDFRENQKMSAKNLITRKFSTCSVLPQIWYIERSYP